MPNSDEAREQAWREDAIASARAAFWSEIADDSAFVGEEAVAALQAYESVIRLDEHSKIVTLYAEGPPNQLDAFRASVVRFKESGQLEGVTPFGWFLAGMDVAAAREKRLRDALEAIAGSDALVEANEEAFAGMAFRRVQAIARAALREEQETPR